MKLLLESMLVPISQDLDYDKVLAEAGDEKSGDIGYPVTRQENRNI